MIHAIVLTLALAGFALLALAMDRHQRDLVGRRLGHREKRCARVAAFLLLALAFLIDGVAFGLAYGAIAWFGHLSAGAWAMVAGLAWRARRRGSARLRDAVGVSDPGSGGSYRRPEQVVAGSSASA